MTPNHHRHVAGKERNVKPILERARNQTTNGRLRYFRRARQRKQSKKIYRHKSYRSLPKAPDPSMRLSPKGFWPFLKRLAGVRKSLGCQREQNIKDSQKKKKQEMQDCEIDVRLGNKSKISRSESEYFEKRNEDWDSQAGEGSKQNNFRKVYKPETPNLSGVQRSNFRIRLYYQLNVVERTMEKPSYITLHLDRQKLGKYCPVTRLNGKQYLWVERSKPIAMQSRFHDRRISDIDLGKRDNMFRRGKTNQSDKASDDEDIFALDIEPILRS